MYIRAVGLDDGTYSARVSWLVGWLGVDEHLTYKNADIRFLSQSKSKFDVLLVHGRTVNSIKAIVRDTRRIFNNKIIIAVAESAVSAEHADILNCGADVLFLTSTDPKVASATYEALVRRFPEITGQDAKSGSFQSPINKVLVSDREAQILNLIASGRNNIEIGASLAISPRAVELHRKNLIKRLNVRNTAEVISIGLDAGVIEAPTSESA